MLIRALRVRDFRNIAAIDLAPHPRFTIFEGANGQGKTNLIEALYLLSSIKSFRPATSAELIRFGQDEAQLEASVERGGHERLVRVTISEKGKRVSLNSNPVRQLADFFGTLNVVMFGPRDIALMRGAPSERRRFLDRAIFNAQPAFAAELGGYDEVLKQRNALLKSPRVDPALLGVYDDQLVAYGAAIVARRLEFMRHFEPIIERTFASVFGAGLDATLRYECPWAELAPDDDLARIELLFAEALARTAREERERGHTLVGPHRDDLGAALGGHDVRAFASQGQHRALVLAMKIAEITLLEERYHFAPILLLDDVSSELDRERNALLFEFLRARTGGQVFITTTHRDYILLDDEVAPLTIDGGALRPAPDVDR